jgi:hypothetical protein
MHSLRNRLEKIAKGLLFYLFIKVVQINYIFSDNVQKVCTFFFVYCIFTLHIHSKVINIVSINTLLINNDLFHLVSAYS